MEQRTEEWFASRLGKVTASKVADVMAKTKSGYSASRDNYMAELLCQRLTGRRDEGYTNSAMQRGTDLEPVARSAYEVKTGSVVSECGFIQYGDIAFGASPDGLICDDGLIEIKCPNTATHLSFIRTGVIDGKYVLQMQVQMICTGRAWCDFVSYDDRLPEEISYKCVRVMKDEAKQEEILTEVKKFLRELDALEIEMIDLINKERQANG